MGMNTGDNPPIYKPKFTTEQLDELRREWEALQQNRRRVPSWDAYRASEALKSVGVWLFGSVVAVLAVWKAAELLAHVVVFGW